MSGIIALFRRSGAPVSQGITQEILRVLQHRGPDGEDYTILPSLAIGHQHFWTTPEEVGERQPLADAQGRYLLAFDGRLDNRAELLQALRLATPEGRALSDAALVLRACFRWPEGFLERLLGPFALVLYDRQTQTLSCACDPLAGRTLFYYLTPDLALVASEEQALLAHPAVAAEVNETAIAQFFALQRPAVGSTFFRDIHELKPGVVLAIDPEQTRTTPYWRFTPRQSLDYASDEAYAEAFRALLFESVQARLRSPAPSAVLMSGGIDSTSVAAAAVQQIPAPLTTISWVYETLPGTDERPFIDACNRAWNTDPVLIRGDDSWPLAGYKTWPVPANSPYQDPYIRLDQHAFQAAADRGIRTLLTGHYGDGLFTGYDAWLAELLFDARFREAGERLLRSVRQNGWAQVVRSRAVRRLLGTLLDRIPGSRRLRPYRARLPAGLTAFARERLESLPPLALERRARRPWQHRTVFHPAAQLPLANMAAQAAPFAVELRYPYRDRRLVEFMLALPAYQLFQHGLPKFIARSALRTYSPEPVRRRTHISSFRELFLRGIAGEETARVQELLYQPDALWPKYLVRNVIPVLPSRQFKQYLTQIPESALTTIWLAISLELWYRYHLASKEKNEFSIH